MQDRSSEKGGSFEKQMRKVGKELERKEITSEKRFKQEGALEQT
jgi:hypothetical protein